MRRNALWNCKNPFQGKYKKVLCICSAGLLRSPTLAWILGNNGYNSRAAGIQDYALIEVDEVLIEWADIIVFAAQEHYDAFAAHYPHTKPKYHILNIPDIYEYRDPKLIKIAEEKLQKVGLI